MTPAIPPRHPRETWLLYPPLPLSQKKKPQTNGFKTQWDLLPQLATITAIWASGEEQFTEGNFFLLFTEIQEI
jgi:hypothetical protein